MSPLSAQVMAPIVSEAPNSLAASQRPVSHTAPACCTSPQSRRAHRRRMSPLGGRGLESFTEDPYLSGKLAGSYVNGGHSKDVVATVKAFCSE